MNNFRFFGPKVLDKRDPLVEQKKIQSKTYFFYDLDQLAVVISFFSFFVLFSFFLLSFIVTVTYVVVLFSFITFGIFIPIHVLISLRRILFDYIHDRKLAGLLLMWLSLGFLCAWLSFFYEILFYASDSTAMIMVENQEPLSKHPY